LDELLCVTFVLELFGTAVDSEGCGTAQSAEAPHDALLLSASVQRGHHGQRGDSHPQPCGDGGRVAQNCARGTALRACARMLPTCSQILARLRSSGTGSSESPKSGAMDEEALAPKPLREALLPGEFRMSSMRRALLRQAVRSHRRERRCRLGERRYPQRARDGGELTRCRKCRGIPPTQLALSNSPVVLRAAALARQRHCVQCSRLLKISHRSV
jgi:hypothetical protein